MTKRRGFTIVELLIVIGIITILIALLMPVLSSARSAAQRIKCCGNLQQMGQAFAMYENNNRNYLPMLVDAVNGQNSWEDYIFPYLQTTAVFLCPGQDLSSYTQGSYINYNGQKNYGPLSYMANGLYPARAASDSRHAPMNNGWSEKVTSIGNDTILVTEEDRGLNQIGNGSYHDVRDIHLEHHENRYSCFLFADGSAAAVYVKYLVGAGEWGHPSYYNNSLLNNFDYGRWSAQKND